MAWSSVHEGRRRPVTLAHLKNVVTIPGDVGGVLKQTTGDILDDSRAVRSVVRRIDWRLLSSPSCQRPTAFG